MKQGTINPISTSKETELAKKLVSDDAQERFDCLKEIEKIIKESKLSENQFRRMWKALFYGLWAADKMKIQMEVAMTIAKLIHLFDNESMLKWMSAGLEIFHREWDKLDYWRTNKFLSLARFCLNEVYLYLEKKNFNGKLVKQWNQILLDSALGEKQQIKSTGLSLHFLQIFVESLLELDSPPYAVLKAFLDPFVQYLAEAEDKNKKNKTIEFVFKFFLKNLQEGQFSSFDAHKYASYLLKKASSKEIKDANRKYLYTIQKEFLKFVAPENPLGVGLDIEDDEELADEGIDIKTLKKSFAKKANKEKGEKNSSESIAKNGKQEVKKGKAAEKEKKEEAKTDKKEAKGKLNKKVQKKEEEKIKRNARNDQMKKQKMQIEEEEDDEDEGEWEDENEEEEEEEIEEIPKQKKGAANKNQQPEKKTKDKEKKTKQPEQKVKNGKRGRNQIEEDDEEEELPEDWEEELMEDEALEELTNEEELEELELLSSEGYKQLAASGLLGKFPPYLYQTPKQQKVFFNKLNQKYYTNLEGQTIRKIEHSRKVNFQMAKNTVKEFNKKNKVVEAKSDLKNESPGKSILKKKSTIVTSSITGANKNTHAKQQSKAAVAKKQREAPKAKKTGKKKIKI